MDFPEGFAPLLSRSVGEEAARAALEALSGTPSVSVRLNPAKLRECPFPGARPVAWSPWGFLLQERPVFTLDPLFHAGCYYVQDSSAMFAGEVFRRLLDHFSPGIRVLDLCAAPGGKTTDLGASLRERFGDDFSLLSNEVMKSRAATLRSNLRSWGDPRIGLTSRDPSAFGREPSFDLILTDVPCSGEGMFRKDPEALRDWSPETVAFCAARQRRILSAVWPALRPGGILLYATCTFNQAENDENVEWMARELGGEVLETAGAPGTLPTRYGQLLLPGRVPGEGQFVAAVRKSGDGSALPGDVLARFGAERPGAEVPPYPLWNVDRRTALLYLHGEALRLGPDAPAGLLTIAYEGHPLGPAKNLGSRCNNLYPKDRRIRMDIR